jgi:hypothetical protein
MPARHRKRSPAATPGYFAWEAAGLRWLVAAGATTFGSGPPGWRGDGWLGPLREPLPLALGAWDACGPFYAQARLTALLPVGRQRAVDRRGGGAHRPCGARGSP